MGAGVQPESRYAWLGQDRIAYQVLGEGTPDLVMTGAEAIDVAWEDPGVALFLRSLASVFRLILFDRRGTGASDPPPSDPLPPWESHAEELAVVLDEVGSERAAILAEIDTSPAAIFFAATRPGRTSALILVHASAKYVAGDHYPIGIPREDAGALVAQVDRLWGTDALRDVCAQPSW
jgi:pimeloyl-ACP methyl ester carboxylesterase